MEYVSVDPVEAPVVLFDAKKGSSLKAEKTERGVVLRDAFRRLLWLAQASPLPELGGSARGAARGRVPQGAREVRADAHGAAVARLRAAAAERALGAARVGRDGGRQGGPRLRARPAWTIRPRRSILLHPSESRETELRKFLWPVALSHQPIGRDARDPPPPRFLLTAVDLDLAATAGNDVEAHGRGDGRAGRGARCRAALRPRQHLVRAVGREPRHARGAGAQGDRRRGPRARLRPPQRRDHRRSSPSRRPPDRPVRLRFEIDGDFLVRPGGDNYWELGVWSWFPQPYLGEQDYTFHAVVRVPKPFVPFASGHDGAARVGGRATTSSRRGSTARSSTPSSSPASTRSQEEVRDGVTIRVATYALENRRRDEAAHERRGRGHRVLQEFLGPFPFAEFNIIEINDYGFGQAPPGVMFITTEAFDPLIGDMNGSSRRAASRARSPTRSRTSTGASSCGSRATRSSGCRSRSPSTARRSS